MIKKFLAMITAVIMLVGMLPCVSLAASSGKCGENLTWRLNNNGVLTISGTGDMEDYSWWSSSRSPFYNNSNIKSIVIGNGVMSIGDGAFYGCSSLTSVDIPNSVTSIGNWAFYYCRNMTSVEIPNSVTSIGMRAFYGCSNLTSVDIPNSVTSIENGAFFDCSGLTNVSIGSGVTSIEGGIFSSCGSLNITVDENNENYASEDGVLFNKDKTEIIAYAKDKIAPEYVIPDSVTSIENGAFSDCSGLTSITIPNSVTSIGDSAFYYCNSLTRVEIPDSVTSIGYDAFAYCSSLTRVEIPDSVTSIENGAFSDCSGLTSITIPNSVTSIGDSAFWGCSSLTSVEIPDSVTSIGEHAFCYCSILTSVNIPDGVTALEYGAFENCDSLTNVGIPDSVTSIGNYVFAYCDNLRSIDVAVNNLNYTSVDGVLFDKTKTTLIQYPIGSTRNNYSIPESVTSIEGRAFSNCESLTSIIMPESVTSIGDNAFSSCSSLTSVEIPNSVTNIGDCAFYDCSGLTDVYYGGSEEEWENISIGPGNSYLTNATIHYNYVSATDDKIIIASGSLEEGVAWELDSEGVLTVTASEGATGCVPIAIGYSLNGEIRESAIVNNGSAEMNVDGMKSVKIFLWESLSSMKPICEAKVIEL